MIPAAGDWVVRKEASRTHEWGESARAYRVLEVEDGLRLHEMKDFSGTGNWASRCFRLATSAEIAEVPFTADSWIVNINLNCGLFRCERYAGHRPGRGKASHLRHATPEEWREKNRRRGPIDPIGLEFTDVAFVNPHEKQIMETGRVVGEWLKKQEGLIEAHAERNDRRHASAAKGRHGMCKDIEALGKRTKDFPAWVHRVREIETAEKRDREKMHGDIAYAIGQTQQAIRRLQALEDIPVAEAVPLSEDLFRRRQGGDLVGYRVGDAERLGPGHLVPLPGFGSYTLDGVELVTIADIAVELVPAKTVEPVVTLDPKVPRDFDREREIHATGYEFGISEGIRRSESARAAFSKALLIKCLLLAAVAAVVLVGYMATEPEAPPINSEIFWNPEAPPINSEIFWNPGDSR